MTIYCDGGTAKWLLLLIISVLICRVSSLPKPLEDENSVRKIFSESKREVSPGGGAAMIPLIKSPLFNPYFMYPGFVPGKPFFYPPLMMSPSDLLLNRFAKSTSAAVDGKAPAVEESDPTLMSAYFKAKKDAFLTKLFEKLANTTETVPGISARSVSVEDDDVTPEPTKPTFDSSFFLKKKYAFLETLFKTINATVSPSPENDTETASATTTPKPTIVPPDFWFPFAKLPKTPKPPKPPKPTKPPKAKKILKDALDTILLQSLLLDLGVDPKDAALNKRAAAIPAKKAKGKKVKPEEDPTEFFIPEKVDPNVYSAKAADCLDKLFKILNKTKDGESDLETYVSPKATVVPLNLWTKPTDTEYTSKLDAFLDLLIKSLNATDSDAKPTTKPKSKSKAGKKAKRSTFLDELLHRVTTPEPATTTEPETTISPEDIITDSDCVKEFIKECCCDGKCFQIVEGSSKSRRSLMFRPYGSGFWVPQYLYAAKMGMYLDKLMDSINTAAASDVESESENLLKRSVDSASAEGDPSGLSSKQAAIDLIIKELSELKNDLVDAFADGIQAQKDAAPTPMPYGSSKKSFKKPFWGPKAPPTVDPVIPIQKRIDILNDVYDKLTKIEKTLIFASESEYDPKLMANLTEILQLTSPESKPKPFVVVPTQPTQNPDSPAYFLTKTKEYLQNLYGEKSNESE